MPFKMMIERHYAVGVWAAIGVIFHEDKDCRGGQTMSQCRERAGYRRRHFFARHFCRGGMRR